MTFPSFLRFVDTLNSVMFLWSFLNGHQRVQVPGAGVLGVQKGCLCQVASVRTQKSVVSLQNTALYHDDHPDSLHQLVVLMMWTICVYYQSLADKSKMSSPFLALSLLFFCLLT